MAVATELYKCARLNFNQHKITVRIAPTYSRKSPRHPLWPCHLVAQTDANVIDNPTSAVKLFRAISHSLAQQFQSHFNLCRLTLQLSYYRPVLRLVVVVGLRRFFVVVAARYKNSARRRLWPNWTHLNTSLGQIDLHRQVLSREHVRIVRLGECRFQLLQLL